MRVGPVSDLASARLEVREVGAGGDFAVGALRRKPDLEVVGLRRVKSQVTRTQRDDTIRQVEPLQHLLRVPRQQLELLPGLLRCAESHQLDLVELVLTDQSPNVFAV